MKICIVAEGCYPFVVGGVSSWIHSLIQAFPMNEFVILAVVSDRSKRGQYQYDLADNVSEVYEVYLNDYDWEDKDRNTKSRAHLNKKESAALKSLILNENIDWDTVFNMFERTKFSINDLLMGVDFLQCVKETYRHKYSQMVFSDFLWTMRSIYLPMFLVLK